MSLLPQEEKGGLDGIGVRDFGECWPRARVDGAQSLREGGVFLSPLQR